MGMSVTNKNEKMKVRANKTHKLDKKGMDAAEKGRKPMKSALAGVGSPWNSLTCRSS